MSPILMVVLLATSIILAILGALGRVSRRVSGLVISLVAALGWFVLAHVFKGVSYKNALAEVGCAKAAFHAVMQVQAMVNQWLIVEIASFACLLLLLLTSPPNATRSRDERPT